MRFRIGIGMLLINFDLAFAATESKCARECKQPLMKGDIMHFRIGIGMLLINFDLAFAALLATCPSLSFHGSGFLWIYLLSLCLHGTVYMYRSRIL
jgi:hypothetical protein